MNYSKRITKAEWDKVCSIRKDNFNSYYRIKQTVTHAEIEKLNKQARCRKVKTKVFDTWTITPTIDAILYIVDVLRLRGLRPPYIGIQLKDIKLADVKDFSKDKYYKRIDRCIETGILNADSSYYIPNKQSRKYNIDIDRLLDVWKECERKILVKKPKLRVFDNVLYKVDWKFVSKALHTGEWYPMEEAPKKVLDKFESIFRQIDSVKDLGKPFFITTKDKFSTQEESLVKQYYFSNVVKKNRTYKECQTLCDSVGHHMNFTVRMKKDKNGYFLYSTGRQNNSLCYMKKEHRKQILNDKGFDGEFDLHSAIYSVSRLLNTGKFDCDWDIKKVIDYSSYGVNKKEFKKMLFFIFFCTKSNAYRAYSKDCLDNNYRKLSKDVFMKFYDNCQMIVGGTSQHRNNIFIKESLLELRVLEKLKKMNISFHNVYDCFYFKTSEITEREMKKLINNTAEELKDKRSNIRPMRSFMIKTVKTPARLHRKAKAIEG